MVKVLMNKGVPHTQRDPYGNTPLQKAQLHEEWEVVEFLKAAEDPQNTMITKWMWGPDI